MITHSLILVSVVSDTLHTKKISWLVQQMFRTLYFLIHVVLSRLRKRKLLGTSGYRDLWCIL